MILYTTLQKLIGRKLLIVDGLDDLGISTMREELASLVQHPFVKKEVTTLVTTSPTVGQNSLQNNARKPSGPGALKSCIQKSVSLISSRVCILFRLKFCSSKMQLVRRLSRCSGKETVSSVNKFLKDEKKRCLI